MLYKFTTQVYIFSYYIVTSRKVLRQPVGQWWPTVAYASHGWSRLSAPALPDLASIWSLWMFRWMFSALLEIVLRPWSLTWSPYPDEIHAGEHYIVENSTGGRWTSIDLWKLSTTFDSPTHFVVMLYFRNSGTVLWPCPAIWQKVN